MTSRRPFRTFDKVGYDAIREAQNNNATGIGTTFMRYGCSYCETCQSPKPKIFKGEKVNKGWKCADCRKVK